VQTFYKANWDVKALVEKISDRKLSAAAMMRTSGGPGLNRALPRAELDSYGKLYSVAFDSTSATPFPFESPLLQTLPNAFSPLHLAYHVPQTSAQ
jgi:hypothetical protein